MGPSAPNCASVWKPRFATPATAPICRPGGCARNIRRRSIIIVLQALLITLPLLGAIAYLTFAERKVIGAMQMRKGPNVVGWFGLLQPIADGVKLVLKETVVPTNASRAVFIIAPALTFLLSVLAWVVIPFADGWVVSDINVGVLFLFAISGLGVYGIVMAGWASNSKYAFLGSMRSAAQMVSYEVSMGFVMIDPFDFIRTIAVARILMPASYVRMAAGRTQMSDEMQALCFMAGANSMFCGERLLTCDNPTPGKDNSLFGRLGLQPERKK